MVKVEVDGIILRIVTDDEDPECAMGAADAVEFLAEWVRIYEELRDDTRRISGQGS